MSKVRVASFSVSLDGYGAGPDQDLQNPMGVGGMVLHAWAFPTRTFKKMQGGTTFYFVTEGMEVALRRAIDAAHGQDVRIGGGTTTVRQYLRARLIDEMHLAVSPKLLGRGEN